MVHYIILCHVMSCHVISYHVMSCHIISYHIIIHHLISYCIAARGIGGSLLRKLESSAVCRPAASPKCHGHAPQGPPAIAVIGLVVTPLLYQRISYYSFTGCPCILNDFPVCSMGNITTTSICSTYLLPPRRPAPADSRQSAADAGRSFLRRPLRPPSCFVVFWGRPVGVRETQLWLPCGER